MEIELHIVIQDVLDEVARTTSYTGQKMEGETAGKDPYGRIFTTDADLDEMTRFWDEARSELVSTMKDVLKSEQMEGAEYKVKLNVSMAFDRVLKPSMEIGIRNYFVQAITAKWFVYTNKGEAKQYAEQASQTLRDVREKAYYKKAPEEPCEVL